MRHATALLSLLLLSACSPFVGDLSRGDSEAAQPEREPGVAWFAVLGPAVDHTGADIILLDGRGDEVGRLPVPTHQTPWEEHWTLAWHPDGFFVVGTAEVEFLIGVDPVERRSWEFAPTILNQANRTGVAADGRVIATGWDILFELTADGEVLSYHEVPAGGTPLVDAIQLGDELLTLGFDGSLRRVDEDPSAPLWSCDEALLADLVGRDLRDAAWLGYLGSDQPIAWLEPGEPCEVLGTPEELGIPAGGVMAIAPEGLYSVWILTVDVGYGSSRIHRVTRSGSVREIVQVDEVWTDLVVFDQALVL
jgi:hypothetical protein